jgi:hypothetical protein
MHWNNRMQANISLPRIARHGKLSVNTWNSALRDESVARDPTFLGLSVVFGLFMAVAGRFDQVHEIAMQFTSSTSHDFS